MKQPQLRVGDVDVAPGKQARVELPVARLFTGGQVSLPVVVLHGRKPGPRLWLDAAIHGDELNGIRIIREVLRRLDARRLGGSILAVPVVNVFGLILNNRYLPDRRDLNRSFPGSKRGSLASRLAHLFLREVVDQCEIGIDLHTAGPSRTNFPHLRADLGDPEIRRLAEAFGAPLVYRAPEISGSLRQVCRRRGKRLLVYEAGEPLRFNDWAIDCGVAGVMRVLHALEMIDDPETGSAKRGPLRPPAERRFYGEKGRWVRASRSGMFHPDVELGEQVGKGQVIGTLTRSSPEPGLKVKARIEGLVMGFTVNPLVHQGDALVHLVEIGQSPADAEPADAEPAD